MRCVGEAEGNLKIMVDINTSALIDIITIMVMLCRLLNLNLDKKGKSLSFEGTAK